MYSLHLVCFFNLTISNHCREPNGGTFTETVSTEFFKQLTTAGPDREIRNQLAKMINGNDSVDSV